MSLASAIRSSAALDHRLGHLAAADLDPPAGHGATGPSVPAHQHVDVYSVPGASASMTSSGVATARSVSEVPGHGSPRWRSCPGGA